MKFPTSPPLCFQSHTIVAQQKSRRHNISRLLFLKTFNWLSFSFLRRISIRTNFEEKSFAFLSLGPVDSVWWFSELAKDWSRTLSTLSTNDLFWSFQIIYDARILDNIGKAVMSFLSMTWHGFVVTYQQYHKVNIACTLSLWLFLIFTVHVIAIVIVIAIVFNQCHKS